MWVNELKKLKLLLNEDQSYKNQKKYINSFNFINHLSRNLNERNNIVTDMGTSFTCTMQSFKTKKIKDYLPPQELQQWGLDYQV